MGRDGTVEHLKSDVDRLLGASEELMFVVTLDGFKETTSSAAAILLGYVPSELIGQPLKSVLPGITSADLLRHTQSGGADSKPEVLIRHGVTKDGDSVELHLLSALLRDGAGVPSRITYRSQVHSDRLARDSQLRQMQRLSLIGRLARGVAHDLNNILSVVMARSEMLLGPPPLRFAARRTARDKTGW